MLIYSGAMLYLWRAQMFTDDYFRKKGSLTVKFLKFFNPKNSKIVIKGNKNSWTNETFWNGCEIRRLNPSMELDKFILIFDSALCQLKWLKMLHVPFMLDSTLYLFKKP